MSLIYSSSQLLDFSQHLMNLIFTSECVDYLTVANIDVIQIRLTQLITDIHDIEYNSLEN